MLVADAKSFSSYAAAGVLGCAVTFAALAVFDFDRGAASVAEVLTFAGMFVAILSFIAIGRGEWRINRNHLPGDRTAKQLSAMRHRQKATSYGLLLMFVGFLPAWVHGAAGYAFFPHWQIVSFALGCAGLSVQLCAQAWYLRRIA